MTTIRRSVEQTIARTALRRLRERAAQAGTPAARPDAPAALALLLDATPATPDIAAAPALLAAKVGCVMVPLSAVAAWAEALDGSAVRVGAWVASAAEVQSASDRGASELEILTAFAQSVKELPPATLAALAAAQNAALVAKLDLTAENLTLAERCRLASQAFDLGAALVVVPADEVAVIASSLGPDAALKAGPVATLAQARDLLTAGAARLTAPDALSLLAELVS